MRGSDRVALVPYVARFVLLHAAVASLVAALVLPVQRMLPAAQRVTLDAFAPYQPLGIQTLAGQVVRAVVIALVLYAFMGTVLRSARAGMVLFGALWGLAVVGSVEPMPGSIEGVLYVLATPAEHVLVLAASAVEAGVFVAAFVWWQRRASPIRVEPPGRLDQSASPAGGGFVLRFTTVHVVTYAVAGIVFFSLQDYETIFATEEVFAHFRPLDGDPFVAAAIPAQLLRGALLALLVMPFAAGFLRARHGWALLFVLLWGLTHLASPIFVPALIAAGWGEAPRLLLLGTPEVTAQMLVFAVLLVAWQDRAARRRAAGSGEVTAAT